MDVYLQPHSDDICFSLGALAHRRRRGVLLTLFPHSNYVPAERRAEYPAQAIVTETRLGEDAEFARRCGLGTQMLGEADALTCGIGPFNVARLEERAASITAPLMAALSLIPAVLSGEERPWLFCPSGIGNHVDHLATLTAIGRNYEALQRRYRIGFYEDLHYAAKAEARDPGVARLLAAFPRRTFRRHAWPLAEAAETKLALIRLYQSQFAKAPRSLEQFTPASDTPSGPHEAVWSEEPSGPA